MPVTTSSPPADFQGTTISLTNPGGIGTVHSVPRLTKGQGSIIGAGALVWSCVVRRAAGAAGLTEVTTSEHDILDGVALALAS